MNTRWIARYIGADASLILIAIFAEVGNEWIAVAFFGLVFLLGWLALLNERNEIRKDLTQRRAAQQKAQQKQQEQQKQRDEEIKKQAEEFFHIDGEYEWDFLSRRSKETQ